MKHLSIPALAKRVPDEASAYEFLEELRWEGRPVCPHCGSVAAHYFLNPQNGGRKTNKGKVSARRVWKCKDCRRQFSVLTGTVLHGTKIPVRTWLFVMHEMSASKNGVSAREVARKYELSTEAAWFMCHRLREAMRREPVAGLMSGTVIADETWIGGKPGNRHGARYGKGTRGVTDKQPVFSLLSHETGEVRSQTVPNVKRETLRSAIVENVELHSTTLHTDGSKSYVPVGREVAGHETVDQVRAEYVRGEVTTNHLEGYFSQLKRSLDGTHHHVSVEHLDRYLAEFDYRYSTRKLSDTARMARLVGQTAGRRLTYRPLTGRP